MPTFTAHPTPVEAIAAVDLINGVRLGALELPPWLETLRQAGRLRIRPDAVEVYLLPAGIVLAGPSDMLVAHEGGAFPLRTEWFDTLFAPPLSS